MLNASPVRALPGAVLAAADPLIVNAGEAAALAAGEPDADPDALAAALLARGARSVVVTLGADGARWTTPAGTIACAAPRGGRRRHDRRRRRVRRHARRAARRGAEPEAALAAAVAAGAEAVGWRGAQPG